MSGLASPRRRNLALGAIMLLVALLMLPNLIWVAHNARATVWITALLIPLALLLMWFALLGRWPWLACLLLAPFALLAPLETYYVAQYHHPTSAQIIATIVATNPLETREYFGNLIRLLALALLVGLAIALLAAWMSFRASLRWCGRVREWILVLTIGTTLASGLVSAAATPGGIRIRAHAILLPFNTLASQLQPGYPFGVIPRVLEYRQEWQRLRVEASKFQSFRFQARRVGPSQQQRQVYVLVIGESSSRANWQLFGYDRPTNPELSKLQNVVPITHMVTSWPESITAIPTVITRRKPDIAWNTPWHEASILRAMHEADYETYWISNQQAIGKFDSPVSMYAYEADHVEWLNHATWASPGSYDADLIQPLQDALKKSNRDLFVVLHMMGSHTTYDYRYPSSFARFNPIKSNRDSRAPANVRIRNSYDNSILYTDYVLSKIINTLKASGAVTALWYESDHGELLPTASCNQQGHGFGTLREFQIPALFWYSDAYERDFPQRVATLRTNADKRTLSADTFESIIDMSGVTFPAHDESWSLFSPSWRYHTRWVHQIWKANFDDAIFGKRCGIVMPAAPSSTLP
jgi:glucan phosphoethanolaminetransferase (alkaline phosphatase superfamily)